MRYLLISLSLILLNSCSSLPTTQNFLEEESAKIIINNYFANTSTDYVYKAKIVAGTTNFGGLLIIKKIATNHHRVVFTTEFGNKIFDFEFIKEQFKVNFVLDKLDKKIIINALKRDFQLLVNEYNKTVKKFVKQEQIIYKTQLNKKDNYYFLNTNNELSKIIMASKRKEKVSIQFKDVANNIAKNIELKHHNFKMTIQLNYINN